MQQAILILHVVVCLVLILAVMLQQGKGAEAGAAFGSGASQTIFGSQGSDSFIHRLTYLLMILFFCTSIILGFFATMRSHPAINDNFLEKTGSLMDPHPKVDGTENSQDTSDIPTN